MKKKIIIALTIVLCFSIMVIKKASANFTAETQDSPNHLNNWYGNIVENNGYCDLVYFNTCLNVQQIYGMSQHLTFYQNPLGTGYIYPLLSAENGFTIIMIRESQYIEICYIENINTNISLKTIFYGINNGDDTQRTKWVESQIIINSNLLNNNLGLPIGLDNNVIKQLFSSTPLEYLPSKNSSTSQEDIDNAYNDGWQAGYDEGYDYGYDDGEHDGYNEGASEGYQDGYEEGIKKGEEVNANLGDMFLNILDSPRQAISNILNFEFLGINLASLVFFLITAILVVVIIKFFI